MWVAMRPKCEVRVDLALAARELCYSLIMATTKTPRIGNSMAVALSYIMSHPGVCTAQVDRACRTARGGHQWMYATVKRLIKGRMVTTVANGARADLYITAYGCERLAGL